MIVDTSRRLQSVYAPVGEGVRLDAAIGEHQSNTDVHALMDQVPFRDDHVAHWGHGGRRFAGPLRASGAAEHDPLSPGSQDRRLADFFARYLERNGKPEGPSTLTFGTLGTDAWQSITSWPPADAGVQRWYLGWVASLTREAGLPEIMRHRVDAATSTGATNRWLAIDMGRAAAYPDRKHADDTLLTFTPGRATNLRPVRRPSRGTRETHGPGADQGS